MILFQQDIMNIRISSLFCFFSLYVNCSAASQKWNTLDVDAIQKLTSRLDFLEQRLTREHPHFHDVEASLSNEKSSRVNEGWIRDMENRIEALENTIIQKNFDKKIQTLDETVKELSKQVKQQTLYNERTERLEAIVRDQEKTIFKLREEVMQIKKPGPANGDLLVHTENENDKDGSNESNHQNRLGIMQRIRTNSSSSDPRAIVTNRKRLLLSSTVQPVATSSAIAFYAYMSAPIQSVTIQHSLVFDVVKTNVGNGYHRSTGVFIAPETGIYVFTWTMRENGDCRHSTQLMVNTLEIGIIHVHVGSGGDLEGTGVVVTHVNAGDDVYVRTHANWNDCYIVSDIAGRSSFAGWKLS